MKTRVCLSCNKSFVLGKNCRRIYCCHACVPIEIRRRNMAKASAATRTHGESFHRTPEYDAWRNMRRRCLSKAKSEYYSGRGISVCERWSSSFQNFLSDVGRRPDKGYSIDRIDNEGSPGVDESGSEYVSRWRDTYTSDAYRIKRSSAARVSAAERKAGAEPRNPKRKR